MSSKEVNLLAISLKQYYYKIKANTDLVNRLIITQIIALLFSLAGGSGMGIESQGIFQTLEFKQFKNDFTIDQFKLQNFGNFVGMSASFGEPVIYIRVPKSMEIDQGMYSDDQIQMISGK